MARWIWSCNWEISGASWKDYDGCFKASRKVFPTEEEARAALKKHQKRHGDGGHRGTVPAYKFGSIIKLKPRQKWP